MYEQCAYRMQGERLCTVIRSHGLHDPAEEQWPCEGTDGPTLSTM